MVTSARTVLGTEQETLEPSGAPSLLHRRSRRFWGSRNFWGSPAWQDPENLLDRLRWTVRVVRCAATYAGGRAPGDQVHAGAGRAVRARRDAARCAGSRS